MVTIGNFDGCHRAHQVLIRTVISLGQTLSVPAAAFTFEPRPEVFFRPAPESEELFSRTLKTQAFDELGLARHVIQNFDKNFSDVSHETFYRDLLLKGLGAKGIVIGDNFRFGHRRLGSAAWLAERGKQDGIQVIIVPPQLEAGDEISSTRIRHLIRDRGAMKEAADMLGRPYSLWGQVERGDRIGRTIGIPTLNLGPTGQLVPRPGVYAGYIWTPKDRSQEQGQIMSVDRDAIPAVFSIGPRPSVVGLADPEVSKIEGHLLYPPPLAEYDGVRLGFYFSHWLRETLKFANLAELKSQIANDIVQAKGLMSLR